MADRPLALKRASPPADGDPETVIPGILRQPFQMRADLVGDLDPFSMWHILANHGFDQHRQVIAKHIALDAAQGSNDRRDLVHDVEAITFFLDHSLKAANLALDAAEARQLSVVAD